MAWGECVGSEIARRPQAIPHAAFNFSPDIPSLTPHKVSGVSRHRRLGQRWDLSAQVGRTVLAVVAFTQNVRQVTEDMATALERAGHRFKGYLGEADIDTPFQAG